MGKFFQIIVDENINGQRNVDNLNFIYRYKNFLKH